MKDNKENYVENDMININECITDNVCSMLDDAYIRTKSRLINAFCTKKEGAAELVVVVILIIISIALCAMYKTEAAKFFKSIFTKLTTDATALFTEATSA